jgi:hypothetical protein
MLHAAASGGRPPDLMLFSFQPSPLEKSTGLDRNLTAPKFWLISFHY